MPITVATPRNARGFASAVRALVRAALALEGAVPGEIAVVLGDDGLLRDLNRRYRRRNRATDVLSFRHEFADRARGRRRVSGDIVISLDRVEEQARRYGVSRGEELARLVVHGALHLAGLDHHRPAEGRHMWARQERALGASRRESQAIDRALARRRRPPTTGTGSRKAGCCA